MSGSSPLQPFSGVPNRLGQKSFTTKKVRFRSFHLCRIYYFPIWNSHNEYLWIKALYHIISYAAIIAAIVFYQSIKESHRKEKENTVLAQKIENLQKHISKVETLYGNIRSLKHDMKNHVMVLENLFCQKEEQAAIGYLSRLKEQLDETDIKMKSGNPVTDIILMEKKKEAEEKGIVFSCDFHYPEGTQINAFDVSVILNNALGNAIEGAEKCGNPYIYVRSYRRKNAYG